MFFKVDIKITYYKKPITRNMILTDQKTAPKNIVFVNLFCRLGGGR